MAQKKYASLSTLSTFLDNLKNLFATKTDVNTSLSGKADTSHKHSISDTTNLQSTLDGKVPTSRTINNKSLSENITLSASDIGAASSTHDHNDKYYQKSEVDTKLNDKSDKTHNHDSDYADINHNHDGVYAVESHNHDTKYDSKGTASSVVSTHNTATDTHNDIRLSITELTTKLNNFLDVDDTTTDQLSELLTLIENNATDIESITNGKVNVSDIIDNLTTNVSNKPLSAAQGVEIKRLIDALQSALDKKTEIYWISTSYDNTAGGTYTDKTFTEMYDALYADKILMLVYGTMIYHYKTDYYNDRIEFFAVDGKTLNSISVDTNGKVTATSVDVAKSDHTHKVADIPDLTVTATELNYMDGVTSNVQAQLDSKANSATLIGRAGEGNGAEIFNDYTNNTASGRQAHAEGYDTTASGMRAHAEGQGSTASAQATHAEGYNTQATDTAAHSEGYYTEATGKYSHAEGYMSKAQEQYAHAEGYSNTASGEASHAEGYATWADGNYSHTEGRHTTASGEDSHAEGFYTHAASNQQHVQGKYNIIDRDANDVPLNTYAHIVGNGTSNTKRSNAHTLDWDGNAWFAGDIFVGGASQDDASASKVVSKADQRWNLLYDSGEISAIANSISNIDVSGYTNIQVLVRIYNDGDSINSRAGSAIFTCENGKTYQFPVWSNMFSKSINTVYTMATFNLVDGWLVCPYASRLIGDASTFEDTEGGTAGNLSFTGSGMMKCTSPLSTLTVSSLDQNSNYYFGMGSRVMVWGWQA